MALQTINGTNPAGSQTNASGSTGVNEYTTDQALTAANFNGNMRDLQQPGVYSMATGVITGGICTASGLAFKIPSGTYYFAEQIWFASSDTSINITDSTPATYVWACSDGNMRLTTTSAVPIGFVRAQCCLMALVASVAGVCTIDLTVQDKARQVDNTNRIITDYTDLIGQGLVSVIDTIPAGMSITIPTGHQKTLFGPVKVSGTLIIKGRMRITA